MYWRGIPHFDPDEFATVELSKKQGSRDNALLPALFEMVKYLVITAAIYLILAMTFGVLRAEAFSS
jgi:hypothetical protein